VCLTVRHSDSGLPLMGIGRSGWEDTPTHTLPNVSKKSVKKLQVAGEITNSMTGLGVARSLPKG